MGTEYIGGNGPAEAPERRTEEPYLESDAPAALRALSTAFAAQADKDTQALKPTLAALQKVMNALHDAGHVKIGFKIATYDALKALKLVDDVSAASPTPVKFGILDIHDAKYLVRILPGNAIDCHSNNLNKYAQDRMFLSYDSFWHKYDEDDNGDEEKKDNYRHYNLDSASDRLEFLTAVLKTAALCAAHDRLKAFDAPAAQDNDGTITYTPKLKTPKR